MTEIATCPDCGLLIMREVVRGQFMVAHQVPECDFWQRLMHELGPPESMAIMEVNDKPAN